MLLGLLVCVESVSIQIESGGIRPDIVKAELLNAKELLRRELPETQSKPEQPKAFGSLVETQNAGTLENVPIASQTLREYSNWAGRSERETGALPPAPNHNYPTNLDPRVPGPPAIIRIPIEPGPCGNWSFMDDPNLKHGHYALNRWHPCQHKGGPPHLGVTGHWALNGHEQQEEKPLSLKDKMKLRNAERRNPSVPKYQQDWPPADGEGYKFHGHWAWHDQNDYKHPDWVRPEEIMSKGNAALGPGRWAWNWQHQNEIWKPMPREEYKKWRDHIERVSPDHSIYEMSNDPICASCAGGCALPGRCEFQGSNGLTLQQFCIMKEGKLCAESYPGVKPPEGQYEPEPPAPPGPAESSLGTGYWDDTTWVTGQRTGQPVAGH